MLNSFFQLIKAEIKKPTWYTALFLAYIFFVISFFDKALAVGLLLLLFLSITTIFFMQKSGISDKEIYIVFLLGIIFHLIAVLFIYYFNFKPFGGGSDSDGYNKIAIELANRFGHGSFYLTGLYTDHFWPILVGILYMLILPSMIVGQIFTVWLAGLSVVFVYLLILEIGGTKKSAFLANLFVILYPSYLYFGSNLLKDTVVTPLVILGLLLTVKILKHFSWTQFFVFFVVLTGLINLRFYVGYALTFSLILSWPLLANFVIKKKMMYWLMIIFVLGFPSLIVGNGYYGFNNFAKMLNLKTITYYREVVYSPSSPLMKPQSNASSNSNTSKSNSKPKSNTLIPKIQTPIVIDSGSTFIIETGFKKGPIIFLINSTKSFTYSLLGPLPWQFTQKRQIVGLIETIPWYILITAFLYSAYGFIKRNGILEFLKYFKWSLPLLFFSFLALGALALFINNYGIIARIRIPMFICFISLMCIMFNNQIEIFSSKFSKFYS